TKLAHQRVNRVRHDIAEPALGEVCQAHFGRLAQGFELEAVLALALLDQPKTVAQHFTRVLVTARSHQRLNYIMLMVRQDDISCRHRFKSSRTASANNIGPLA